MNAKSIAHSSGLVNGKILKGIAGQKVSRTFHIIEDFSGAERRMELDLRYKAVTQYTMVFSKMISNMEGAFMKVVMAISTLANIIRDSVMVKEQPCIRTVLLIRVPGTEEFVADLEKKSVALPDLRHSKDIK